MCKQNKLQQQWQMLSFIPISCYSLMSNLLTSRQDHHHKQQPQLMLKTLHLFIIKINLENIHLHHWPQSKQFLSLRVRILLLNNIKYLIKECKIMFHSTAHPTPLKTVIQTFFFHRSQYDKQIFFSQNQNILNIDFKLKN